jgi:hypothetical protein
MVHTIKKTKLKVGLKLSINNSQAKELFLLRIQLEKHSKHFAFLHIILKGL